MIDLTKFQGIDSEVRVTFTDGTSIVGRIDGVDDEEESELGEIGISFFGRDGGYFGFGQSEIADISIL
ncbi:MAG: hypothetical protein ACOX4I_02690 [Anaerovoracaceae bacterium]|jgi:hypothetical protein